MKWYMPCRLGEKFQQTKFVGWEKDTRIFVATGEEFQLTGIGVGMKAEWAKGDAEIFRDYTCIDERGKIRLESYNVGKWNFENLMLEVPDREFEARMVGKRKARLIGFYFRDGAVFGHFMTCDRFEHFHEPVDIDLQYTGIERYKYIHFDFKEDAVNGRE